LGGKGGKRPSCLLGVKTPANKKKPEITVIALWPKKKSQKVQLKLPVSRGGSHRTPLLVVLNLKKCQARKILNPPPQGQGGVSSTPQVPTLGGVPPKEGPKKHSRPKKRLRGRARKVPRKKKDGLVSPSGGGGVGVQWGEKNKSKVKETGETTKSPR